MSEHIHQHNSALFAFERKPDTAIHGNISQAVIHPKTTHQHVEEHDEEHDGVHNCEQHRQPRGGKTLQHIFLDVRLQRKGGWVKN